MSDKPEGSFEVVLAEYAEACRAWIRRLNEEETK